MDLVDGATTPMGPDTEAREIRVICAAGHSAAHGTGAGPAERACIIEACGRALPLLFDLDAGAGTVVAKVPSTRLQA